MEFSAIKLSQVSGQARETGDLRDRKACHALTSG